MGSRTHIRSKRSLEEQLAKLDSQYDLCNEVMARGEVDGFKPELPVQNTLFSICTISILSDTLTLFDMSWIFAHFFDQLRFVGQATKVMNDATMT